MTEKRLFQWRTKRLPYFRENEWSRYISEERKEASRQMNLNDVLSIGKISDSYILSAVRSFREFDILCEYASLCEMIRNKGYDLVPVSANYHNNDSADMISCDHNITLRSVEIAGITRQFLVCLRDITIGDSIILDKFKLELTHNTAIPPSLHTNNISTEFISSEESLVSLSSPPSSSAVCNHGGNRNKNHVPSVMTMPGVQVRHLPTHHLLHGQQGLFATRAFTPYDLVGEYTGRVVPEGCGGSYCAALEDKPAHLSLGIDASDCGNEARFVNCYFNLVPEASLVFRTCFIDTYPHLLLVCTRPVEAEAELLLDYGDSYIATYLSPRVSAPSLSMSDMKKALPMMASDSDNDD